MKMKSMEAGLEAAVSNPTRRNALEKNFSAVVAAAAAAAAAAQKNGASASTAAAEGPEASMRKAASAAAFACWVTGFLPTWGPKSEAAVRVFLDAAAAWSVENGE